MNGCIQPVIGFEVLEIMHVVANPNFCVPIEVTARKMAKVHIIT